MPRVLGLLAGLVLAAVGLAAAPARADAPAPTFFTTYLCECLEGPSPAAGSTFTPQAELVKADGAGTPVAGVPITLLVRYYGSSTFTPVRQVVTDAHGRASAGLVLQRNAATKWSFAGTADLAGTTSHLDLWHVDARVQARAEDRTLQGRQKVVVVGRSAPLKPGQRVSLWRGDRPGSALQERSRRIAVGVVGADGRFRLTARFAHPGTKRLYVKVPAADGNSAGYSRYVRVRVR